MRRRRKEPRIRRLDPVLAAEVEAINTQRVGHVPVRTCAGCARPSPRVKLHRFALDAEGRLEWRASGGRGAYLHPSVACSTRFLSGKALVSALKARVERRDRQSLIARAPFSDPLVSREGS